MYTQNHEKFIRSGVGSVASVLVTETAPFQGSRVRFPVKSLGFFPSGIPRENTLNTGCFKAGFSPEFSFSGFSGFPCLTGANLGECETVVGSSRNADKVG
ncbi:hypothetical protein TSAR_015453 [Trichomalopsis sarcophagae]|uniref:Uncharacterized protein n=1 Tax=Trichomalopsis sarcophagae TaxID=543379 RepID=A0A232EIY4_9HYME|nr:hypothetical protein TSAR_015453 [Trichomalopsis sarcophagae]